MPDEPTDEEPTQTTPVGDERERLFRLRDKEGGTEIPRPTRAAVLRDLGKVAEPLRSQREISPEE